MRLLDAAAMRELDRRAIKELGIPGPVLMENAGRGAADLVCSRWGGLFPGPVTVLAGKGNNGGDGFVIARHLRNRGWLVQTVALAAEETFSGDAALNLAVLRRSGAPLHFAADAVALAATLPRFSGSRLLVDALFGTGLSSEVLGHYAAAIDWINAAGVPVLAIDIPSGVDASSGRILGRAVRADMTATFACAKPGQVLYPGAECTGELTVVDIGIPTTLVAEHAGERLCFVDTASAAELLPPRPAQGHKGTFGHLLVVAGSSGKAGAAALTAEAGVRSGTGLVTVAAPATVQATLAVKLTEAMTEALPEQSGALDATSWERLAELWPGKDALALGPGLGQTPPTMALVRRLLRTCPVPLVIDADGLNAIAGDLAALAECPGPPPVLTPHPGEMARLAALSIADIEADRLGIARDFAMRHRVVLVLKGARTVVADPAGHVSINGSGNPGLASGGMGDVLTGLIGGLLAQGMSPANAALLGVHLHGLAADRLAATLGTAGLSARDVIRELPAARQQLRILQSAAQ